jgi:hypothetical protein
MQQANNIDQPATPTFKYITSNNITASESKSLIWWISYICFGYHYKVIICGFFGKTLGYDWLCHTLIQNVTSNHWFEHLVYVPILWYAFYRIIIIVFGPLDGEMLSKKVQRLKTIAMFLLVGHIYGYGMHFFNTTEIYSRVYLDIDSGPLYDQIRWVDEQFSHWVQFFFYFLLFTWLIIYDRLDRVQGGYLAIFTGLIHGLERAVAVIEGDSPYLALVLGLLLLSGCVIRWKKHNYDFPRAWKDFFFRHGVAFGISMPLAIFLYQWVFNGFIQPSEMGDTAWYVVVFVGAFALVGFLLALLIDRILEKESV